MSGLSGLVRVFTAPYRDRVQSQSLDCDVVGFDDRGDHLPHAGLDGRTHFQPVIGVGQRAGAPSPGSPGSRSGFPPVNSGVPPIAAGRLGRRRREFRCRCRASEAANDTGVGAVQPNLEDVVAVHRKIVARHDAAASTSARKILARASRSAKARWTRSSCLSAPCSARTRGNRRVADGEPRNLRGRGEIRSRSAG